MRSRSVSALFGRTWKGCVALIIMALVSLSCLRLTAVWVWLCCISVLARVFRSCWLSKIPVLWRVFRSDCLSWVTVLLILRIGCLSWVFAPLRVLRSGWLRKTT